MNKVESRKNTIQKLVTQNMRLRMGLQNVSQKELAEAIGITPSSLSAKFVGRTLWNLVDVEKAANFFNIKPATLLDDSLISQLCPLSDSNRQPTT